MSGFVPHRHAALRQAGRGDSWCSDSFACRRQCGVRQSKSRARCRQTAFVAGNGFGMNMLHRQNQRDEPEGQGIEFLLHPQTPAGNKRRARACAPGCQDKVNNSGGPAPIRSLRPVRAVFSSICAKKKKKGFSLAQILLLCRGVPGPARSAARQIGACRFCPACVLWRKIIARRES